MDLSVVFASSAQLEDWGPKSPATSGEPFERGLMLHEDAACQIGIWECSPGTWESAKMGVGELMHFVSGHGWITDADGRWEILPGATRWFPDGWSGRWEVDQTVRKVFAIVTTNSSTAAIS